MIDENEKLTVCQSKLSVLKFIQPSVAREENYPQQRQATTKNQAKELEEKPGKNQEEMSIAKSKAEILTHLH